MQKTEPVIYRRHVIKTMKGKTSFQARAFRGNSAVGDVRDAETLEAAIMAVKAFLDDRSSALRQQRGANGFPCTDEVRAALSHVAMNKAQEAMLMAHRHAPDHILTATQLAAAAGYENFEVANRQYGQLGHDLAIEMDWTPGTRKDGTPVWTYALAEDAGTDAATGHFRWRMRPEVVQALP